MTWLIRLTSLTFLGAALASGMAAAVIRDYSCKISDLRGTTSPPCTCRAEVIGQPFCPRIEGIQIPCMSEVRLGSCEYDDGTLPPPECTEMGTCEGTRQVCETTGTCEGSRRECSTWTNQTCTRQVQGTCNNWDEGGNCIGYNYTTETYECSQCSAYQDVPYTYSCCKAYKDETYEYPCCKKYGP